MQLETVLADWQDLQIELDAWWAQKRYAKFWWRDDDAVADSVALRALLETSSNRPLSLAVIPSLLQPSLRAVVRRVPQLTVLQHGYAHINHRPAGNKKQELSLDRPIAQTLTELKQGQQILQANFGAQFLPILVPPWNRIDNRLLQELNYLGLIAWSGYADSAATHDTACMRIDTHIDIIDWRGNRGFIGEGRAIAMLVEHLRLRREEQLNTPIGLLTHHLVHDQDSNDFCSKLSALEHAAIKWESISHLVGA